MTRRDQVAAAVQDVAERQRERYLAVTQALAEDPLTEQTFYEAAAEDDEIGLDQWRPEWTEGV